MAIIKVAFQKMLRTQSNNRKVDRVNSDISFLCVRYGLDPSQPTFWIIGEPMHWKRCLFRFIIIFVAVEVTFTHGDKTLHAYCRILTNTSTPRNRTSSLLFLTVQSTKYKINKINMYGFYFGKSSSWKIVINTINWFSAHQIFSLELLANWDVYRT